MSYDGALSFATMLDTAGFEAGVARLGGIIDGLAMPVERQNEWGRQAGAAFISGFREAASALPGVAAALLAQAAEHSRGLGIPAFQQVGAMLASGLAGGISSGQSSVVQAVAASVNAAIAAAKSQLGIRSPSRLFRDEVGRMMMTGWAGGITQGTQETVAATQDAVQAVRANLPTAADLQLTLVPAASGTAWSEGGAAAQGTQVTNLTQNIHSGVPLSPAEMTREAENFLRRTSWQLN